MRLLLNTPWYVLLLCLAVAAGFTAVLYYRNRKNSEVPRNVLKLVTALRFVTTLLCCLLLADILLRQVINETQQPRVIIAVDNSASMLAGRDSALVRRELGQKIEALRDQVKNHYEVSTVYFGPGISTRPPGSFEDKETDIDRLFTEVTSNYANDNVGAMLLVSDGIYNKGANPTYAADRLPFPVHVMMLGDTAEKTDLAVTRVIHNQVAYSGNIFPVEVQVNARKLQGEKAVLELRQGNTVRASREISINSSSYSGVTAFTVAAGSAGLQRYTAVVRTSKKENNTRNNIQEFVVEVIDNREKVLLLAAAPHPDILALRQVLTTTGSYELDAVAGQMQPPALEGYNLVILHGSPARQEEIIERCNVLKLPFWIVNPASAEKLPGIRISATMNRFNDAETTYDPSFGFFTLSEELRQFMDELPALRVFFGNYDLPAGSAPLLRQRLGAVQTEQPILYFNNNGDTKSAVFLGEGLWKWRMRDFSAHGNFNLFAELIGKCVQYLVVKSDKSFFRVNAPRIIAENEVVLLDAELYNKSYEPVNTADVLFTLTNEQGKKFNYTFSKTARAYRLELGNLPPGEYRYRASVSFSGETYMKQGSLVVRETVAEILNTVADHDLLRQIATRSGGLAYGGSDWDRLSAALSEPGSLHAVVYSQTLTRPLIDQKYMFIFILLLLSTEWFLRKRHLFI